MEYKKILSKHYAVFIPLVLICLIGFATLVSAVEFIIPIEKGWNLVYGFNADIPAKKILSGSEIEAKNIKAVYVYIPQINSYGQVYPDLEADKILQYLTVNDLEHSVYWVYSNKKGMGKFNVDEPAEFTDRIINAGWSFYPVYKEMIGKKVERFSGNCKVEKIYGFDPSRQQWINVIDEEIQQKTSGLGFIIKVKNKCKFGPVQSVESIAPLPQIPN